MNTMESFYITNSCKWTFIVILIESFTMLSVILLRLNTYISNIHSESACTQ